MRNEGYGMRAPGALTDRRTDPNSLYVINGNRFSDEWVRAKAEELGVDIMWGDDDHLLLDIDNHADLDLLDEHIDIMIDHGLVVDQGEELESRNGNAHVVLELTTPQPLLVRILLQAVLGSDRKRELLSFLGTIYGQENPVVLWRPRP